MMSALLDSDELIRAIGNNAVAVSATANKLGSAGHAMSGNLTGTGAAQTWSHGLGAIPTQYWWELLTLPPATLPSVTYGTISSTVITITAPLDAVFRLHAIL
jgi:hypothetical protein